MTPNVKWVDALRTQGKAELQRVHEQIEGMSPVVVIAQAFHAAIQPLHTAISEEIKLALTFADTLGEAAAAYAATPNTKTADELAARMRTYVDTMRRVKQIKGVYDVALKELQRDYPDVFAAPTS